LSAGGRTGDVVETATEPAIARCADRPITTTPASCDGILEVPVEGRKLPRAL